MSLAYLDLAVPDPLSSAAISPPVDVPLLGLVLDRTDVPTVREPPVGRFGIMSRDANSVYTHTFLSVNVEDMHSSDMDYDSRSDSSMSYSSGSSSCSLDSDDDRMDVLGGGSPSFVPGSIVPYAGLTERASNEENPPGDDFHNDNNADGEGSDIDTDDDGMADDDSYIDQEEEVDELEDDDDDDGDDGESLASSRGDRCSLSSCDGECYSYALSDASDECEAGSDDDRLAAMARLGEDVEEDRFRMAPSFGINSGEDGLTYLSRFASVAEPLSAVSYSSSLLFSSSEGSTVNAETFFSKAGPSTRGRTLHDDIVANINRARRCIPLP